MDAKKREIRNVECELCYREAAPDEATQGELGYITGTAIVCNSESEVLDEYGEQFREVILPEAVTPEFLRTQDIKINMLHNRDLTFGRYNRGMSGNAKVWFEDNSVKFLVPVPDCDLGIRARELSKAGVYTGCSFEFWPGEYTIEEREGNVPLVKHHQFRMITALTLGMDPAYQTTTLSARELQKQTPTYQQRERDKEQQERETMQREMQRRAEHLQRLAEFDNILDNKTF